jgi:hypothetical protein
VPPPTISLSPNITADDIITIAESHGAVAITGTAGGGAKAGDTVTVTVNGVDYSGLVATDMTFSINVAGSDLFNDFDRTVFAEISTPVGLATDTEGYIVDDTPPVAPTVALTTDSGVSATDRITNVGTLQPDRGRTRPWSNTALTAVLPGPLRFHGSRRRQQRAGPPDVVEHYRKTLPMALASPLIQ